jgi:NAD(P)H-hydrate repair Nnr-like enzyme with NAD(P)H-hydrate epimerase domain
MNVYYTDDIRSIDADYCAQTGTSAEELIARAARAFTSAFLRDFVPSVEEVMVIAGPGNNGADARGVAGLLRQQGGRYPCMICPTVGARHCLIKHGKLY